MQFIFSLAVTLTLGLTLLQCDKAKAGNTETSKNSASSAVKTNPANAAPTAAQTDEAPRITLEDAKSDFDAGNAIFVDSRPADSYKVEHVKGSINIPLADVDAKYKNIPTNKKIIVYCS